MDSTILTPLRNLLVPRPATTLTRLLIQRTLLPSFRTLRTTPSSHSEITPPQSTLRAQNITKANAPDLSYLDPVLDHPFDQPPGRTLNVPPSFPVNRPHTLVFATTSEDLDASQTALTSAEIKKLRKVAIVVKRVVNMNAKGKQPSMYALVVVGNEDGLAGYGEGKDEEASRAVRKATNQAIRGIRYFHRYDARTVATDLEHKFHATTVTLRARRPGFGIRSNHVMHEVLKCVGIQDASGKVRGSTNPMNVVKATFEALAKQKLMTDVAAGRGKRIIDVQKLYYGLS